MKFRSMISLQKLAGLFFCLSLIQLPTYGASLPINPVLFSCVETMQKSSLLAFQQKNRTPFVSCVDVQSSQRPIWKSTITDQETQFVSEAFEKTMDCFDLPWKKFFAKYSAESGFHSDIMGSQGDTGVGQLTGPAIEDVQQNRNLIWGYIQKSNRQSCQELKQNISSFGVSRFFQFSSKNRCELIAGELGIYRNIFYSGALHFLNQRYVEKAYAEFTIPTLLERAGFKNAPHVQLKEMLVMLSYNNGGRSSVLDLRQYLLSRLDFIQRKSQELSGKNLSTNERSKFLAEVGLQDFLFSQGQQRFKLLQEKILKTNTSESLDRAFRNISVSELGFPEWLRIWQSHGGPGYMNGVYMRAAQISKAYPQCVDLSIYDLAK